MREKIAENALAAKPLTVADLARENGWTESYAQKVAWLMSKRGRKGASAAALDPTTLEGRLQVLKELVDDAPPAVKLRAIEVLEEITQKLGQGVGPRKPLTQDERDNRLDMLFETCSKNELERAVERHAARAG